MFYFWVFLLFSSPVLAGISVSGSFATGRGVLSRPGLETLNVSLAPSRVELNLQLELGPLGLGIHGSAHHSRVVFQDSGLNFAGTLNAAGAGASLALLLSSWQLRFSGDSLIDPKLSLKGVLNSVVNGKVFSHSTLLTYTISGGSYVGVSLIKDLQNRQLRFLNLQIGLMLGALILPVASVREDVRTNQGGAGGVRTFSAGYNMQVINAGLIGGINF